MGSSCCSSKRQVKTRGTINNPESLAKSYFGTPKNFAKLQTSEKRPEDPSVDDANDLYIGANFMFNELFCNNRKRKDINKLFSRK